MRIRKKYTLTWPYGYPCHVWEVECADGALHVHISDPGDKKHMNGPFGGIEVHYRKPPDYMSRNAPSHHNCQVIGGPCWHDGSSMQATEKWIPMWMDTKGDHEFMFKMLEAELIERFYDETEE